ncbi:MAG TPA: hypothetical protein VK674_04410 [Candidatus Limnocylindria bacterium]|nr:hypothetical protein [Candidatus Limnocylindria bacterium]
MTKVGLGLPGASVGDIRESAATAAGYDFASFSVYGDLGDLPPYAVLHAAADELSGSTISAIGPMGIPVGLQHPENVAMHAVALEQQLPGQTYVGLVRGAFLDSIGQSPASIQAIEETVHHVRKRADELGHEIPIYIGGFGEQLLARAGDLAVEGVKLGGSTNPELAEKKRTVIANDEVKLILGAVSVIDVDRKAARYCARIEVAKYLAVVGTLDPTLSEDELDSLGVFSARFQQGDSTAPRYISDSLLDKFAIAGTPDDALSLLARMEGVVDRFEFGTPHGLKDRPTAIRNIGESIIKQMD